ncbi:MAG: 60 kDa inner membrane insertion protein [Microgenomates bacterium 39_7]|nr:MAG: 60 kDa inner membrane insertion protein [Microgenomates bacterium 39_7]
MIEQFFTSFLIILYSVLGNLGLSIVMMTLLIKALLLPASLPSLKAQNKMKKVAPKIEKLKKKFKNDPKGLQQAQVELYKKYNVNPLAGCLPQIVMIIILVGLYRSLNTFLENGVIDGIAVNTSFLWLNLTQPDQTYVLPILAGLSQLILSIMISPGGEVRDIVPNESKNKKTIQKNKDEEDMASMAKNMQQQMIYIMPFMTAFIASRFPSGLAVYWVVANLFTVAQQYFVSGWGGLSIYWKRAMLLLNRVKSSAS